MIITFRSATSGKVMEIDFALKIYTFKSRFEATKDTLSLTTDKELQALEKELIKNGFMEEN